MKIAVTGHMDLSADSVELVRAAIEHELQSQAHPGDYVGLSCIARGADSIFAEAVLKDGGTLNVILPSRTYREKKVKPDHAPLFDDLLSHAAKVLVMPFDDADKEAYEAANEELVGQCDRLFAVWDGQPGKEGGTATVVDYARASDVPVSVIWPDGAARSSAS